MRKQGPTFRPLSLAQRFEAPEDFIGCFGWLSGYSADAGFLDDAVERFTRRVRAQRAFEGRIAIAAMLDPSNPQLTPKEIPGVMHLPLIGAAPFRLLHAKVALLGFRHISDVEQWRLRLLVSTGNWTRQTLEESLDLSWCLEVSALDLKSKDEITSQACADLSAAWKMLEWLRRYFDVRVLNARLPDRRDVESGSATIEKWIAAAMRLGTGLTSRFFDNRRTALLTQLAGVVREHALPPARNYLAMGSGFYESSDSHDIPSVLRSIVDTLREAELVTRRPDIDIFVNPTACQAVANSVHAFSAAGWKVREPGQPEYFRALRSLHAKFIFSANSRDNSEFCNSAWLYLGSGNLTGPGFTNPMDSQSGNLEAGVVLAPTGLRWCLSKGVAPEHLVTNLLPLQWKTDFSENAASLASGNDMPDAETRYSAAPVPYFLWIAEQDAGWLRAGEDSAVSFDLLDENDHICQGDPIKGFPWRGLMPRQVRLRWRAGSEERQAWVPVIDEFGRVAATSMPALDIEEAWSQLANFPMPPDEEELLADGNLGVGNGVATPIFEASAAANYPVRQMMQLVENIAAKQISVTKADWVLWCTRLEQCLIQATGSPVIDEFLKLSLNPLSPLWHGQFRPDFAIDPETLEGLRYEDVLKRIETAWNVAHLTRFGEQR